MKTLKLQNDEYFNPKDLNLNFDLSKCNFQMDILQEKLLQFYIKSDRKFRRAFHTNWTNEFFQFIKDKNKLKESLHLSTIGQVRSGKSMSMISCCIFHQALYNRKFNINYICANEYEYIEKLQTFSENELFDRIFLLDEEKQTVYGSGSVAKKMKMQDVQNIIAINNISTIAINPISWANPHAFYGLRAFGRCMETGINRFMLYNLQSSQSTSSPMGLVFIPMFQKFIPDVYAKDLEKKYLDKKLRWVEQERKGEGDVLAELRKNVAKGFIKDKQYLKLIKKDQKMTYISTKLGSEWTKSECLEIFNLIEMLKNGVNFN